MIPQVDEHAHLDSPFHSWDPRFKLLGFGALIFAFSCVNNPVLLLPMLVVSLLLYCLSRLPWDYLLERLKFPGFFVLMLAVMLPLLYGETVLLSLGPLSLKQEGSLQLLIIAVKLLSILVLGVILFGTASFQTNVRAMSSLGMPILLTDMILFSYRYLFEFAAMLKTMETAVVLRGFQKGRLKGIGTYALLVGTMLVRSYEQSERVYKAMILRGYGHKVEERLATEDYSRFQNQVLVFGGFLIIAALFIFSSLRLDLVFSGMFITML